MEQYELNAKLQQKKNKLRKELARRGILKREGENSFDRYSYFSEAQYKQLFTGLFSEFGLELSTSAEEYIEYEGTSKQAFGRIVKVRFTLTDIDTGYFESSEMFGEGMDKGDKGGYKAYTGALKYYLANTFMVATGDDAEKESPEPQRKERATFDQLAIIKANIKQPDKVAGYLNKLGVARFEDLTKEKADEIINNIQNAKSAMIREEK